MDNKPEVSILVTNYNSFEAIQLVLESIRYYTRYPNYKIIVYHDASYIPSKDGVGQIPNMVDRDYLRGCHEKGWIILHENLSRNALGHGGALNKLVNVYCDTDYVAILDCDTQIRGYGWLEDLMRVALTDEGIIAIVDHKPGGFSRYHYRTGFQTWWFGLLNMNAYRDGMQVDWQISWEDRRKHPYTKELAEFYPPENCKWTDYWNQVDYIVKDEFDVNKTVNDPGSQLYIKTKYFNPKGYKVVSVPPETRAKYHHFGRISRISLASPNDEPRIKQVREERFAVIKSELTKLRTITGG